MKAGRSTAAAAATPKGKAKTAAAATHQLNPVVLQYDEGGLAVDGQDAVRTEETEVLVEWGPAVGRDNTDSVKRCLIFNAIVMLQRLEGASMEDVEVLAYFAVSSAGKVGLESAWKKDEPVTGKAPARVHVRAKRDFEANALVLVPVVKRAESIVDSATSPKAVQVQDTTESGQPLFICPAVNWEAANRFVPPFWVARRSDAPSSPNLVLATKTVTVLFRVSGAMEMKDVSIPVFTNPQPIKAGAEIIAPPYAKDPKDKDRKRMKVKTWEDSVRKRRGGQ